MGDEIPRTFGKRRPGRVFGGVPGGCDCDEHLLKLLGDFRHEGVRFVVVREFTREEGQKGVLLFGHDLQVAWLEGPVHDVLDLEVKEGKYKEAHR